MSDFPNLSVSFAALKFNCRLSGDTIITSRPEVTSTSFLVINGVIISCYNDCRHSVRSCYLAQGNCILGTL